MDDRDIPDGLDQVQLGVQLAWLGVYQVDLQTGVFDYEEGLLTPVVEGEEEGVLGDYALALF